MKYNIITVNDTFISRKQPHANFSAESYLVVGSDGRSSCSSDRCSCNRHCSSPENFISILAFDFSLIECKHVEEAYLYVYVEKDQEFNSCSTDYLWVGRNEDDYDVATVDWANSPYIKKTPYNKCLGNNLAGYLKIKITDLVRFWLRNPQNNFGLGLAITGTRKLYLGSSRSNHPAYIEVSSHCEAIIDNEGCGGFIKAVDKAYAKVGDILTYTISVKNTGNLTANNVIFLDSIPSGTALVQGSVIVNGIPQIAANPDIPAGMNLGSISACATTTVVFQVKVHQIPNPDPIPNSATVKFNYTINGATPNSQSGFGNTNIVLTQVNQAIISKQAKYVNKTNAKVGDILTYTINFQNTGNVPANNVLVIDTIPSGTTLVPNSVVVNGITMAGANPQSGINVGSVNAGASISLSFNVVVNNIPVPNPIPNVATINYAFTVNPINPNSVSTTIVTNTATTQVNTAIIDNANGGGFVKSADKAAAVVGDIITYTIVLKNTGNTTAFNVLFKDTIPTGTTLVANSVTVGGIPVIGGNPQTGVNVGIIQANASSIVTFKVTVVSIPQGNIVQNKGTVNFNFAASITDPFAVGSGNSNIVSTTIS